MSMSSCTTITSCKSLDLDVIKDITKSCERPAYLEPLDILSHAWKYRGEGNANVVIALENEQRVIRLSKVNVGELISDFSKHRRKVEREVIFANRVFGQLIGPEFVGSVKAVQLSQDQISLLNGMIHESRPEHRRHKEIRVPYATSHCDFARIHRHHTASVDVCVEIKPKQGWWPSSMRNSDGAMPNLCTYCLNQFLKLKRAKIASRTCYCPLDLFSGNPHRMIEGVTALIANPQNNFRVFCDGKLVYGETSDESLETVLNKWMGCSDTSSLQLDSESPSTLNSFIYLLCVALLKPKYIPTKCQTSSDIFDSITNQIRALLYQMSASDLYKKIMSKAPMKGRSESESELEGTQGPDFFEPCNSQASPLPDGCILSRILEIQKLAERQKHALKGDTSIYTIYQKICPVHCPKPPRGRWMSSMMSSSGKLSESDDETTQLEVILTGDELDNFVDSGTETERMSDSESYEGCFDVSSTEDEEEDTITSGTETISKLSQISDVCPSTDCLACEKWLDEIEGWRSLSSSERSAAEMYLLAATAKDCSIMVTFSPTNNNYQEELPPEQDLPPSEACFYRNTDLLIGDLSGKSHRVRIGVADLDPKPVTTIVRHYLRDMEMIQAYKNYCNV